MVRHATKKILGSVDAVVGLGLLAAPNADKHMATVLPNCVLVWGLKRLESLVTDITGVNLLSLVLCPPTLIPFRKNMNSVTNLS